MANTKEFILKDKFSYIYDGYEKFYFVDDQDVLYDLDKMSVRNVWLWKCAKVGDKLSLSGNGNRYNVEKIN